MTPSEITKFRKDFASIVFWKGMLKSQKRNVGTVTRFDKNGSHQKATLRSIETLDDYREKFDAKLKGKTYEEWAAMSRAISVIKNKIQRSATDRAKQKWQEELFKLSWENIKPFPKKKYTEKEEELTVEDMEYTKKN